MPTISFSEQTAQLLRSDGKRFVVTGATGWLGRATLEMLASALGDSFQERVAAYGSREQKLQLSSGQRLSVEPLASLLSRPDETETYLHHFAFLTKDRVAGMPEQEYFDRNRAISRQVRGVLGRHNIRGVMVASSGAVYDFLAGSRRDTSASPYGQLKAEDEEQFTAACAAAGVPLVIPRIFNLSGPYINKLSAYALSSIIVDVLRGGPIRLMAQQPVLRSYVYVGDVVELCTRWLLERPTPDHLTFDSAGKEVVEIGELARRVRTVMGADNMTIDRPEMTSSSENRYVGDATMLRRLAGEYGFVLTPLDEQIRHTAEYVMSGLEQSRGYGAR